MKKKAIRSLLPLVQDGFVQVEQLTHLENVIKTFSLSITDEMYALIKKNDPHDPIGKQFIPSVDELNISALEQADPIGDEAFTKVKGIIHRYPDRCLLMPVNICPVYCRFCFRREQIANSSKTLNANELEAAYQYIENCPDIWEVIITGGDPFILKPLQLKKIITRLTKIKHVEVIRIHTRVPIVESSRMTKEMIDALNSTKAVYVVLHANHPQEFTDEAIRACNALVNAGIPMLSQTTLLKNLNDNIEVLSSLMRCFVKNRIKPYYLHHADLARGTQHFRTSIEMGQTLMKQLRGRFSGMCQPTYVLDIPGGNGKIPIGPSYIEATDHTQKTYQVEDYQGSLHEYKACIS